jgi:hypothetical protein
MIMMGTAAHLGVCLLLYIMMYIGTVKTTI